MSLFFKFPTPFYQETDRSVCIVHFFIIFAISKRPAIENCGESQRKFRLTGGIPFSLVM